MSRLPITPMIPANEHEHRVYHGNLALNRINTATQLGERTLTVYHDSEPRGMGSEKVVYPNKDRGDQVVAFYRGHEEGSEDLTVDELKQKYFTIKLMHLLLPEHIPDAHLVGTEPRRMHLDAVADNPMDDELFGTLYKDLKAKARALGVFLDPKPSNFLLDDDGYLKYVDDFGLPEDSSAIEAEIGKIEDPTLRERAHRYATRAFGRE